MITLTSDFSFHYAFRGSLNDFYKKRKQPEKKPTRTQTKTKITP